MWGMRMCAGIWGHTGVEGYMVVCRNMQVAGMD